MTSGTLHHTYLPVRNSWAPSNLRTFDGPLLFCCSLSGWASRGFAVEAAPQCRVANSIFDLGLARTLGKVALPTSWVKPSPPTHKIQKLAFRHPQMRLGTRPPPLSARGHQPGPHRISLHVQQRVPGLLVVQRDGVETRLPEMPHASQSQMKAARVVAVNALHGARQARLIMRDSEKMDMVVHETVSF
jgi:hypothetical protein